DHRVAEVSGQECPEGGEVLDDQRPVGAVGLTEVRDLLRGEAKGRVLEPDHQRIAWHRLQQQECGGERQQQYTERLIDAPRDPVGEHPGDHARPGRPGAVVHARAAAWRTAPTPGRRGRLSPAARPTSPARRCAPGRTHLTAQATLRRTWAGPPTRCGTRARLPACRTPGAPR